jgi:hypothetical protein
MINVLQMSAIWLKLSFDDFFAKKVANLACNEQNITTMVLQTIFVLK